MTFLTFEDLKSRGLFTNRQTLARAIDLYGFPPGLMITPNRRCWPAAEVEAWLSGRPVAHPNQKLGRPKSAA